MVARIKGSLLVSGLGSRPVDGEGRKAGSSMVMSRRKECRTILRGPVGDEGLSGVCLSV